MTREEVIRFWKFRYENAKDFSDPHWEAQERREHREYVEALRMAIDALQTEVVRCKDCRWYEQKQKHLPYNVSKRYCNRSCVLATKENDFCSYGERREP